MATGTTTSLPDVVTLGEVNSSGLSGTAALASCLAADDTIVVRPPRYYVQLFNSPSGGGAHLRAEAITFDPNPGQTLALTPWGGSSITGTVYLTYTGDTPNITLQVAFYLVSFYSDSARTNLVARAGSRSTGNNLVVYPVNGSGLSGDIDLDSTAVKSNLSLGVGYSAGDSVEFDTNSLEEGVFQCFFRDNIGQALPAGTGNDVTIPDGLAGGGLQALNNYGNVHSTSRHAQRPMFATGRMADGETVTLTDGGTVTEVYEFDTNNSVGSGHVAVAISGNANADDDMVDLAAAIAAHSTLVTAEADSGVGSLVRVTANASGSAANACTLATTAANLTLGGSTLTGGADAAPTDITTYSGRAVDAAEAAAGVINLDTPVVAGILEAQVRDAGGDPITDFTTDGARLVAGATPFEVGGTVRVLILGTEA